MKGLIAAIAAVTTIGFSAPAQAEPGSPLDFVYFIYLSNHGVTVPDDMIEAAGDFARRICSMAAHGATLSEIDTLVHIHYDNVGPVQTRAIESGAAMVYCPPKQYTSEPIP